MPGQPYMEPGRRAPRRFDSCRMPPIVRLELSRPATCCRILWQMHRWAPPFRSSFLLPRACRANPSGHCRYPSLRSSTRALDPACG